MRKEQTSTHVHKHVHVEVPVYGCVWNLCWSFSRYLFSYTSHLSVLRVVYREGMWGLPLGKCSFSEQYHFYELLFFIFFVIFSVILMVKEIGLLLSFLQIFKLSVIVCWIFLFIDMLHETLYCLHDMIVRSLNLGWEVTGSQKSNI